MDDLQNKKAMLLGAKTEMDAACAGFTHLSALIAAIRRLATGTDVEIVNLADLGATLASEFADEARSAADEYARLLENLEVIHG